METATVLTWLQTHFASLIGALLGIKGGESVSLRAKVTAFALGVAVSYYFGGGIADYFALKEIPRKALELGLGLFAMRIVEAVESQIGPFFRAMRVKTVGNDPDSKKGDL